MKRIVILWLICFGTCVAITACDKKDDTAITPEQKAADEKAAVVKALAEKTAADQAAADKAAADKAAADKVVADKAAADKAAADAKVTADNAAAQQKAEAAALPSELVLMKSEMSQALSQIDITIAKLEALSVTTDSLKQPSKDAIASIDALDEATQSIKKRATDMRERGASYFDAWEKQLASVSTPAVAAIAAQRKDELSAQYAQVLTSMQSCKAAFDPFWADMQKIRTAVDDGLTPETQKTLATQVKTVKDEAATLKERVQATSAMLDQVKVIYTRP